MALQTCSSYTSNGCDTSMNSFGSLAECEDFCLSAGCNAGDTVYKDPNSNRPFLCNTALQNNCPSNYQCTLNGLTQEHVCCGSDSLGVCPTGEKAYIDPRTNSPRQCAMAADGKCPGGYLCRFSQNNHKYYCCGSISGAMCPAGRALFRYTSTQLPLQCHIGAAAANACPIGFACLSDVQHAFQGYCCSQQHCGPNEHYNKCGTHCENNCKYPNLGPRPCIEICGPAACTCDDNYYRNADGDCVTKHECGCGGQATTAAQIETTTQVPNPCADSPCTPPSICIVDSGDAKCIIPASGPDPCAGRICRDTLHCAVVDGFAQCVNPTTVMP